ncbi:SPOR domain-containing protein [Gracilimonas sp. BCB1]|uniref:SPOR domain-containing protein n=1 Tax=Gracilimonas sp. BCB1 TaxID=3152362 RepID=UPI0032D91EB6
MHIDHQKLVELLTETSGIEKEKVESQLEELVEEIKEAIAEGDAYEVSGLGVFSGIGNNILFIPSDDFATEINYKYVGMEPIEMDDAASETTEEAPQSEEEEDKSDDVVADAGEDDDPFGGLLEDENKEAEETPSFELDDSDDEPIDEDTSEDAEEFADEEEEAPFDFAEEDLEDNTEEEISDSEEPKPGPDKWGIDTYKDDSAERTFSGLLGDKDDDAKTDDSDLAAELNKQLSEGEEDDDSLDALFGDADVDEELEGSTDSSGDDDDDPFADLAGDEEEAEDLIDSDVIDEDQDEIIPVITNLASEETKKKRAEQEKEQSDQEDGETAEKEDKSSNRPKRPSTSRDSQGAPVLLWVLLIIVVLAGGTYGLGYFGVVNIPGITPQTPQQASTTQPDPVPMPPVDEETPSQTAEQNNQANQPQSSSETTPDEEPAEQEQTQNIPPQEQATDNPVSQSEAIPAGQPVYGLEGVTNPSANDGYTIVVYSLSNEGNAKSTERELSNAGYRVLLATIPSQQYGQLWRVSLGQFESMRDAAIAAETLSSPLSDNYFITKIN